MCNPERRIDEHLSLSAIIGHLYLLGIIDQIKKSWILFLQIVQNVVEHDVIFLNEFGI
jgi:hypothetical protein